MEIVPFSTKDDREAGVFLKSIFDEMGWIDRGGELSNLHSFFHLPEGGFFLLVKDEGKIVGTAGCLKIENDALMKRFYVDKRYRGTGIAKKLFDAFIETAKSMKLSRIVLDVSKTNIPAIRFYEKQGLQRYNQKPIALWPESSYPADHYYYYLNI